MVDDYLEHEETPESDDIHIIRDETEIDIIKGQPEDKPTTSKHHHTETTTTKPHHTTSSSPIPDTTQGYHTPTESPPCTDPEHVIDGSMSNTEVQSLLKRLLGLHCSCKPARRRHSQTKPIVIVDDIQRAARRTTPDATTAAPIEVTTEEIIINHVVKPRPNPRSRPPFHHLLNSIDKDIDVHNENVIKNHEKKVENTINMIMANEAAKQKQRSRKKHRTSKPIAKTNSPKELRIILDQEHTNIDEKDDEEIIEDEEVDETDVDDEETDNEENFDGQESQQDLQFFRDHRGRPAKATSSKTSESSRNRRTRNRRQRKRGVAQKSSDNDNDRKKSLRPEDSVDFPSGVQQRLRNQRRVERGTTSSAGERGGQSVPRTSDDVTTTDNRIYRASLPVGLKSDTKSGPEDSASLPKEELATSTADLLLQQFLSLYKQFQRKVGMSSDDKPNDA